MCVIIIKKRGVQLPRREVLQAAFRANPDGCGFATSNGESWKGLRFEQFWRMLTRHDRHGEDVLIHFRWATHGSVCRRNCHPFKGNLSNGDAVYFAHNGVLDIESTNDKTDSEICFRGTLLPALNAADGKFSRRVCSVINEARGTSRFAFVGPSGVRLFGDFVKYEGCLCSNLHFLRYLPEYRPRYEWYFDDLDSQKMS